MRGSADRDGAFAELVSSTSRLVWGILIGCGMTNAADRKEAAQEVYLVAHLTRATRNQDVPERAWIGAIAKHIGMRGVQKRRRRNQIVPIVEDGSADAPATEASPEAIAAERAHFLLLVEGMEEKFRVVLEMHEVLGFTSAEIAAVLEIPVGTVSTRLRLAREHVVNAQARLEAQDGRKGLRGVLPPFGCGAWPHALPPVDEDELAEVLGRVLDRIRSAPPFAKKPRLPRFRKLHSVIVGGITFASPMTTSHEHAAAREHEVLVAMAPQQTDARLRSSWRTEPSGAEPVPADAPDPPPAGHRTLRPRTTPGGALGKLDRIDPEEVRQVREAREAAERGDLERLRELVYEHTRRFPPRRAHLRGAMNELSKLLPP